MSRRDRRVFLIDFGGMIHFRLLPLPIFFFRVCHPTSYGALLKTFPAPTTPAFSGAAADIRSAPTRFEPGTISYIKIEMLFSQLLVQEHQTPFHAVDHYIYRMDYLLVLEQLYCNVFFVRK